MSLFPAYENTIEDKDEAEASTSSKTEAEKPNWLTNSSFQPEILAKTSDEQNQRQYNLSSDSSDCEVIKDVKVTKNLSDVEKLNVKLKKSKKKHKKSKSSKKKEEYEAVVENVYFEDKFRDKNYLKVESLNLKMRPLYDFSEKSLGWERIQWRRKISSKRYFALSNVGNSKGKKRKTFEERMATDKGKDVDDGNERLSQIKNYNKQLNEDPNNIELWIEYINNENGENAFDDGKLIEYKSIKFDRKLSIVEKALEKNNNNKKLLKLKYKLMKELIPTDEYLNQIEELLKNKIKVNKNIEECNLLWKILISTIRTSVSIFKYLKLLNLYEKYLENFNLYCKLNSKYYDNNLLKNLYKCFILIRHCGFWEQMCEIIRMMINLNLNININNKLIVSMDEKKLIELEEVILISQLPLNQLWLRVELLRENSHWISVNRDQLEFISDSNRFITPDDVVHFVHPLLTKNSHFLLSVYIILSLKIPLIPTRHTIMNELFYDDDDSDNFNWIFDSIESILPMIYPSLGINSQFKIDLSTGLITNNLTSGPQYLHYHPVQQYYLNYVRTIFHSISESATLNQNDKIAINIWWLRFERMLLTIQKNELNSDKNYKKLKGMVKEFLKKPDNRNVLHYYREYALIEKEMGQLKSSINILETAIQISDKNLSQLIDINEQSALVNLNKTLIEILLDLNNWEDSNRNKILLLFSQMTGGKTIEDSVETTAKYLHNCYDNFINNFQLLSLPTEFNCQYFLPNFYCDVIMCYVYYLHITNVNLKQIFDIFETTLKVSKDNSFINECLYESKIIFLQYIYDKSQTNISTSSFRQHLTEALINYPDNFYLLNVYAGLESNAPNWRINYNWDGSDGLWPSVAQCLALRVRLNSSLVHLNDEMVKKVALNKLLSLHQRFSENENTKSCPLIWRLYMLLLRENEDICKSLGEKIYHDSVSSCPWARSIYIDAAEIAPQFLNQIQDILREKNLRIHVTPDELNILRG